MTKKNSFIAAATDAKNKKICLVFDNLKQFFFTSYLNPEIWNKKTDNKDRRFILIKKFV